MAVIKKKIGNEIKEFPYDKYGLDKDGNYKILSSYQGEPATLKPDGYNNNPAEFKYSCSSTVASLLEEGKTAIFTDEAETAHTLWRSFRTVVTTSEGNDNIYLGYEDDRLTAGLGDDFIEIDHHSVFADGDLSVSFPEGGIDAFVVRCGNAYLAGNGNSDHYFINISQKCKDEGYAQYITINEISFKEDANILHLCDFGFHNISKKPLETLANNGIRVNLPSYDPSLELYFKGNHPSSQKPDIIIDHFCDNYNESSVNPPIASIVDKDGVEISLQGLNCTDIAAYIAANKANTDNSSNVDILSHATVNDTGQNLLNTLADYVSSFHLLFNLGNLITTPGDYLGLHHTEL